MTTANVATDMNQLISRLTEESEMQESVRDLSVVDLEGQVVVGALGVVHRSHLGGGKVSLGHRVGGSDGGSEHCGVVSVGCEMRENIERGGSRN